LLDRDFEKALGYALRAHRGQSRKGTVIPYIAHLLAVSALVIEDGGTETEAVAALLHDVVEDQGGASRLADVRATFGDDVADIVAGCSDTDEDPKPPWRTRKEAYIAHLADASPSVLRVSLADKLHNARAIVFDYRLHGPALWERFDKDSDQLWYYQELVELFKQRSASPMAAELDRVVSELATLDKAI